VIEPYLSPAEGGGTYTKSDDDVIIERKCEGPAVKDIKSSTATSPCQYEKVSCINAMNSISTDDWSGDFTKTNKANFGSGNGYKEQCQLCVRGSKVDGTTRNVLANVGAPPDGDPVKENAYNSNFAYALCDAMVATCSSDLFYANNTAPWLHDCTTKSGTLNEAVCALLQSNILQFFLGFMGGIECTLQIKAIELEDYIKGIPGKIGDEVEKHIPAPLKKL